MFLNEVIRRRNYKIVSNAPSERLLYATVSILAVKAVGSNGESNGMIFVITSISKRFTYLLFYRPNTIQYTKQYSFV